MVYKKKTKFWHARNTSNGVPQGSVSEQTLLLFYITDIEDNTTDGTYFIR